MSENLSARAIKSGPAHRSLKPISGDPRLGGFDNLLSKELGDWIKGRNWIRRVLSWVLIINGITAMILFLSGSPAAQAEGGVPPAKEMAVQMVFSMMVIAGSIGMIIMAQDEIIGEKTTGTAAWVLSKPVSRRAFILAKLLANTIGVLVFVVAIPAAVGYVEAWIAGGSALPLGPYLIATLVAALGSLFYLALAILLGVLYDRRGPVLGICLGILLGGSVAMNLLPSLAAVLPLALQNISTALALSTPLPTLFIIEIGVTILWIIVFVLVSLLRFEKIEF